MVHFLDEVAGYIAAHWLDRLDRCKIAVPGRRAGLYLTESLRRQVDRPLWQPDFVSIDELMSRVAGLTAADPVRLITELYGIYARHHNETLDSFYFWGDVLLSNYDTVDKYRVDARMLFHNISDLKELEADLSYLSEEQMQVVRSFLHHIRPTAAGSDEKQKFIRIWNSLLPIYEEFRDQLRRDGVGYPGMIYREAADRLESCQNGEYLPEEYLFVGFNALSNSEKKLFQYLKTQNRGYFFWDYDRYYVDDRRQESGMFLRENLRMFPAPENFDIGDNHFAQPKQIEVISTPSEVLQCKYAGEFLRSLTLDGTIPDRETAVVLTDENLLLPMLYSVPPEIPRINITMGYPLKQSVAYVFVERLLELQRHKRTINSSVTFYHKDLMGLSAHPFLMTSGSSGAKSLREIVRATQKIYLPIEEIQSSDPLTQSIFRPIYGGKALLEYVIDTLLTAGRALLDDEKQTLERETIAVILNEIYRLQSSMEQCVAEFSEEIVRSLLRKVLQAAKIPFEGEPIEGVQIMGILETRNLDFENVVILSLNDDTFPGNRMNQVSFIPMSLREGYGLPSIKHHEGVWGYYFYRLLQRARNIRLVYCSTANDKRTGEPSRYIAQLNFESPHTLLFSEVKLGLNALPDRSIRVEKNERILSRLHRIATEGYFSPSSLYNYLSCPLKFYLRTVAGARNDEELSENIDASQFGNILHRAAELLYRPHQERADMKSQAAQLMHDDTVERAVHTAIAREIFGTTDPDLHTQYNSETAIVHRIITKYIREHILTYDSTHDEFTVSGIERDVVWSMPIEEIGMVRIGGRIDRYDTLADGRGRIVDYKTGVFPLQFGSVEKLFEGGKHKEIFQILYYALILHRGYDIAHCVPAFYQVSRMRSTEFRPYIINKEGELSDVAPLLPEFQQRLQQIVAELFNPHIAFTQCDDPKRCMYCDFVTICRR